MKPFVVHYCPRCNTAWLDIDITNVKTFPPTWKFCIECCKKLGIDFDKQTPATNKAKYSTAIAIDGVNLKDDTQS